MLTAADVIRDVIIFICWLIHVGFAYVIVHYLYIYISFKIK